MDLYLLVDADKVGYKNGQKSTIYITVDLSSLWSDICSRYTHIHVEVQVYVPIVDGKDIVIQMSKDVEIAKIEDCRVLFEASYCQKEEEQKPPYGTAWIFGYQMIGGSGR